MYISKKIKHGLYFLFKLIPNILPIVPVNRIKVQKINDLILKELFKIRQLVINIIIRYILVNFNPSKQALVVVFFPKTMDEIKVAIIGMNILIMILLQLVKQFISDKIIVDKGDYVGKTVAEFEEAVKKLTLNPYHDTEKDEYSDNVKKGSIVWHGSGIYEKDEKTK